MDQIGKILTSAKSNLSIARAPRQEPLFNIAPTFRVDRNATARNAYGAAAQEIVCAALNLWPIPIDGSKDVCFDAEGLLEFYEIKSCHAKSKVVIYDFRIEKEQRANVPLRYAILAHNLKGERRGDRIVSGLLRDATIVLAPSSLVHRLALAETLCTIKSERKHDKRFGYTREGYNRGYRNLPLVTLMSFSGTAHDVTFKLYNRNRKLRVVTCHDPT